MSTTPTKKCTHCGQFKSMSDMTTAKKNGKTYTRGRCKACDNARCRSAQQKNKAWLNRALAKKRHQRANGEQTEKYIYWDTRGSDRKKGLKNDLTREFIAGLIKDGCSYCGEVEIRMTLDRIDNDRGHTQDNVVPACIRCNHTRKTMPHEAWLIIAPAMREARIKGLFGTWTGRVR